MESRTKNRQSFATIRAMVDLAYGAPEVPITADAVSEFDRGWFSTVYRVRLRSGRRVVLKIAPDPRTEVLTYERGLMRNEIAALQLIEAHGAAPVPAIEHAELSGGPIDAPWFFMSYVSGDNLGALLETDSLSPDDADALAAQLGAINRRLNDVSGPSFGSVAEAADDRWRMTFARSVHDVLHDARRIGLDLADLDDRARAALSIHSAALDEVHTPRLVAWDLWPGNAIVRAGRIAGIVDHERALWGDPLMEAGFMNPHIPIFPRAAAFARGYGMHAFSPAEMLRRRLYSMHQLLVMTVEPSFRGPQDPNQSAWSRHRLSLVLSALER